MWITCQDQSTENQFEQGMGQSRRVGRVTPCAAHRVKSLFRNGAHGVTRPYHPLLLRHYFEQFPLHLKLFKAIWHPDMVPDEDLRPPPDQGAARTGIPRRGRRGGRAGRGRGRAGPRRPEGPRQPASPDAPETMDSPESSAPGELREGGPSRPEPRPAPAHFDRPAPGPRRPATPDSVQGAIEHVNQIIDTLRETLDEMEGVLATLELAERQKTADEQEIDSLRRSMRNLQRPRDDRSSARPSERPSRREDEPSESH